MCHPFIADMYSAFWLAVGLFVLTDGRNLLLHEQMNIRLGFWNKIENVLSSPLFIFKKKAFVDKYSSVWSGVAVVLIHLPGVEYNLNYILTLLRVINVC